MKGRKEGEEGGERERRERKGEGVVGATLHLEFTDEVREGEGEGKRGEGRRMVGGGEKEDLIHTREVCKVPLRACCVLACCVRGDVPAQETQCLRVQYSKAEVSPLSSLSLLSSVHYLLSFLTASSSPHSPQCQPFAVISPIRSTPPPALFISTLNALLLLL